ncbi:L-asparaginase II [Fusarium oxysporum II5]|uniref:L-asparaginase II n=3 Tax=Fusarium oxysporum species complex TaxID=171631 RepID=N1S711_FUSC4|nr:L-asparaginase [Fusarium odoratissimum NRRL 54006]EMT73914.1 hypothetical protein FOC4_g10002954 [Fusarium odoratissimum]EXL91170.1 L-asparaginase [Fusarium odoratissimum NRRL 54006]KAK2128989.1 L-asparaginase II [Fusarium oxysporum II5]TXC05859.1 hypothetical protein FocTR4_00010887 [Fusarium oxysporum f. sp. cubense]
MTQSTTARHNRVTTDRNGIIENVHYVHVAVTDSEGCIIFSVGDPTRFTLARSTAKPAQAVAIIETGVCDTVFDQVDLALICASHNCEDKHVERAKAMLVKAGAQEVQYRCGGHASISPAINKLWAKRGVDYTGGVYNNCSGKHAGMIAGALAIGTDPQDYHLPEHPMQVRTKQVVEDLCPNPSLVQWGVDGCNLPAPAFPLFYLAQMYAKFAAAADTPEISSSARTKNLARVYHAMTQHPEFVAGEGRFCTELMEAYGGKLMGKLGADGCYAVGIRECADTKGLGVHGAVGISVKVDDGNYEVLYAVVMEVLEQLNIGTIQTTKSLQDWHYFKRRNTVEVVIGSVNLDDIQLHNK